MFFCFSFLITIGASNPYEVLFLGVNWIIDAINILTLSPCCSIWSFLSPSPFLKFSQKFFVICSLNKCNIFKKNFRIIGHVVQFSWTWCCWFSATFQFPKLWLCLRLSPIIQKFTSDTFSYQRLMLLKIFHWMIWMPRNYFNE